MTGAPRLAAALARLGLAGLALAGLALALSGCEVALGPQPDAAPCMPSPRYFVSDLWPSYIAPNQCATEACHAFDDGHGYLRFLPPEAPPQASLALDSWPPNWRANYYAAIQLVRCDQPTESRLLTVPEGEGDPHTAGDTVDNHLLAEQMFRDWVEAE